MRILVTGSTFPGAELDGSRPRFVYDLAEALTKYGHVVALAPHHPGAPLRERMGSVDVVRFRYWWPSSRERLTPNMREQLRGSLLAKLQVPIFLVAHAWSLWRLVRRHAITVVNAHWLIPQGVSAAFVRSITRRRFKLALHVHAGDIYFLARIPGGKALARYVVDRSDCVFADGSHVRDTLNTLLGRDANATVQPMGVDSAAFLSADVNQALEDHRDGLILFVGRLVEKKGVIYLIRSLPLVLRQQPGIRLVLIGSGPEDSVLHQEVTALGLERHVTFLGHRPHNEIAAYLRLCTVVVVPSIVDKHGETEGMPTVVVEAMTSGVPVVGSAVDGIPDIIRHGENGWLCRQKDPADLASKLLIALQTGQQSSVRRTARETGMRYDWHAVARNYVARLREA